MESNHLISIITPSYNQAPFLEQTIHSVLSQGYARLQYIIIDGGSSDGSVEIIKRHEKHLTYWISEPDRGQGHAINKGLQHVTGEVVNWLNSDDYLQPGALEIINEAFSDSTVNVVTGRSHIVQDDRIVRLSNGTDVYPGNFAKTLGWARIDQPETFFRKSVFDRLGPINENLHYVMDREFWMRYLLTFGLNGLVKIPDILVNFRLHDASKTVRSQEQFSMETNYLYHQLAHRGELRDTASFIEKNLQFSGSISDVLFSGFPERKRAMREAVHYFLLYKADEAYYRHDRERCRLFLSAIDVGGLAREDRILYHKISLRNHFLPTFVSKWWRS